jgi:phage terminase large subunit-like protein
MPNAQKTVHEIKGLVESNKVYQAVFPECIPNFNKVRWNDSCACLQRDHDYPEGTFEAAGTNTTLTRRHYDIIIEDDTVAPKKDEFTGEEFMPSRGDIEQAIGFHKTLYPLKIDDKSKMLVVGTRWADYDHIDWIKKNEKYEIYDKGAYIDPVQSIPLYKKFSVARLEQLKMVLGTTMFTTLYLNHPLAKENMVFNPDWLQYYELIDLPEDGDTIITLDPADPPTGKKTQDYSAIVACKHTKKGIYVLRIVRDRFTDKQMIVRTLALAKELGAIKIRVETDKYANLEYGFRDTKESIGQFTTVECVKTRGANKENRIKQRLSPLLEAGVIKITHDMQVLEDELYQFPKGLHDDVIDALAWQVEGHLATDYTVDTPRVRHSTLGKMSFSMEQIRDNMKKNKGQLYPFQVQMQNQ